MPRGGRVAFLGGVERRGKRGGKGCRAGERDGKEFSHVREGEEGFEFSQNAVVFALEFGL